MKISLSEKSLIFLEDIITGDSKKSPYRKGWELVDYFKEFGSADVYAQGFPSRWYYTRGKLKEYNGSDEMVKIIEKAFDPRHFLGSNIDIINTVLVFNEYLLYEGLELEKKNKFYRLMDKNGMSIKTETMDLLNLDYIKEQLDKCDGKCNEGDYSGAITNARTLVETILKEIEYKTTKSKQKYDGDLQKLYKDVRKLLDLEKINDDESIIKLTSGLTSVVSGIASLRNKMSDSHPIKILPEKYHAKLAVNCAKTLSEFLLDVYQYKVNQNEEPPF